VGASHARASLHHGEPGGAWRADRKVREPERPPALGTGRPPQRSQGGGIGPQADPGGHERRGSPWPEGP
jgi:hypothetical protein